MSWQTNKPVVIDNGTGFTKMGYGSNVEPDYIVPTAIANLSVDKASRHIRSKNSGLDDLVSPVPVLVFEGVSNQEQHSLRYLVTRSLTSYFPSAALNHFFFIVGTLSFHPP